MQIGGNASPATSHGEATDAGSRSPGLTASSGDGASADHRVVAVSGAAFGTNSRPTWYGRRSHEVIDD